MFDDVGRGRRVRAQREFSAVLLSFLVNGSLVAAVAWGGSQVAEEVLDEAPVEVSFFEEAPPEEPEVAPPAPPPPPPPPPAAKPEPEEEEDDAEEVEPDPQQAEEQEKEDADLRQDLDDATKYKHQDAGVEGGVEGGVAGGVLGGKLGVPGGELGGQNEVRAVHWSEVQAKKRVSPVFPDAAKQLDIMEQRCQVRFFIDEKGVPYDVKLENCPAVFHDSALEAAWKWRFYPMKVDGQAVKAQFVLSIVYKLK
jgi:protein TonB